MTGALLLALQIASAAPAVLSVRAPGSETAIPLIETNAGAALPIARLGPVLPVTVRAQANGHFIVRVTDLELDIMAQVPYVRTGGSIVPLASAPFLSGNELYVPLQVATDILPRLLPSVLSYSPERSELRLLAAVATAPSRPAKRGRTRRMVVDAGHGGPDNGMSGPIGGRNKIYEKNITLAVARKVSAALRRRGVEVVMTRNSDTLIALSDRGRIANERGGDLFLSIHVNAANLRWIQPQNARGFETYFLAEAKTEDARRVAQMENESIKFETSAAASRDDPLSFIINDMAQNEHLRESAELAELVQGQLGAIHPGPDRGVKQAGFRVLVTAFMPAVLIEIGFGTNADEARYLTDAQRQTEIANAIAEAATLYLDHYERRLGSAAR